MQNVDFLPRRFREQSLLRKRQLWRMIVLALFGTIVGSAAGFQHVIYQNVRSKRNEILPQHQVAKATNLELEGLQSELKRVRGMAGLYAWLGHPWPRTQLLAAIVEPLDKTMTLSEIQFERSAKQTKQASVDRRGRRPRRTEAEDEQKEGDPARRDLNTLRDKTETTETVIHVSGLTEDNAALHHYVASLSDSRLFTKAELSSIETLDPELYYGAAQFNLRLVVTPGFGLKGGPEESLEEENDKKQKTKDKQIQNDKS